jgi:hypothetical protein
MLFSTRLAPKAPTFPRAIFHRERGNSDMTRQQRRAAQRQALKQARQATQAQINANRENSTHSTGPQTEAGKAAVSQNRTTHGLNYNAATFQVLPSENQFDYNALLQQLQEEHEPETPTESLLVISMAQHRWLLDRATRLQDTCFDPETGQIADEKRFSLYQRYATTHERAFHKCLNDLLKLRIQTEKSQIGFESQKRKSDLHELNLAMKTMQYTDQQRRFSANPANGLPPEAQKFMDQTTPQAA